MRRKEYFCCGYLGQWTLSLKQITFLFFIKKSHFRFYKNIVLLIESHMDTQLYGEHECVVKSSLTLKLFHWWHFCIYVKFTYGACQHKFITTSALKYRYVLYQMFIFIIHLVVIMCQNTWVFSLKWNKIHKAFLVLAD